MVVAQGLSPGDISDVTGLGLEHKYYNVLILKGFLFHHCMVVYLLVRANIN